MAYVAEMGEEFTNAARPHATPAARDLRQRHREQCAACARFSARFTRTKPGGASPIPSPGRCSPTKPTEDDLASGTIYVLRSKSDHPVVAANRDVLHKIGVTGGDVEHAHRQRASSTRPS